MSEFARNTVYLYLYEKGLPIKNIGFIKRNVYGEQDKLTIHIKGLYTTKRETGEIFVLSEAGENYRCEPIGEIHVENSMGDKRLSIEHSDRHIGIMIHIAEKICLAGYEEEKPDIRKIEFMDRKVSTDVKTIEEETIAENTEPEQKTANQTAADQTVADQTVADQTVADQTTADRISAEQKTTNQTATDQETANRTVAEQNNEMVWNKLASVFPTVHPFENTVDAEYLSITPNELQFFPKKEMQAFMSNSFLQHAYYSYKYIIIGREQKKEQDVRYHVGVPGTYHEREVMMAKMFGFEKFLCAKKEETAQGCFGYYVKCF